MRGYALQGTETGDLLHFRYIPMTYCSQLSPEGGGSCAFSPSLATEALDTHVLCSTQSQFKLSPLCKFQTRARQKYTHLDRGVGCIHLYRLQSSSIDATSSAKGSSKLKT